MINHLDNLMRDLFLQQITDLTDETQIRFQPPDEDWRTFVAGLQQMALNVYLADLRENRKLRSNARTRHIENGVTSRQPAPARMDCHYLISAWSPAQPALSVEPTLDEHELLYHVTAVLMNHAPINPSRIYPPGSAALAAVPELIRTDDLPTQVLPVEGFPKLAEFWGTMGAKHRWKPAIYLLVTLPVALQREIAGPMVTTRITEYRRTGRPETAEVWIQIGGHVLDATVNPPLPLADAWVRLESLAGAELQTTRTNALGRFSFERLQPGRYQLRWRAGARPEPAPREIEVPSPSGEYDLRFE
jgi:hypothetical protein